MSLTREQAARALGMKTREIVDVQYGDGVYLVTTHDGQRVPVGRAGEITDRPGLGYDRAVDTPDAGTPGTPSTPAGPDSSPVPDGSAADVLAWVDGDVDRASRALVAERAREKPRSSLVGDLQKVVRSGSGE